MTIPTTPTNNVYGNIKLINGSVLNCNIENLTSDPPTADSSPGRVYFNTATNKLRYFNGTEYNDSDGGAEVNLIGMLGSMWVNNDYTFNPLGFSQFNNVSGLSINSSLLDVLTQLDEAISNFELDSLLKIKDVQQSDELQNGQLLYYNGRNFTFGTIDSLMENFSDFSSQNLKDVAISNNLSSHEIYVYTSPENVFVNTAVTYNYVQNTPLATHTINHGLPTQYPLMTLVDLSSNSSASGFTVNYPTVGTLVINFQTPTALAATIMFI